ncbi:MAG: DUF1513 domain-containing protein [Pseudomonadota bacterium]
MVIDRRNLMVRGSAAIAAALVPDVPDMAAAAERTSAARFAATRRSQSGAYSAAIFDAHGRDHTAVPLPARGHDIAIARRTGIAVAFARRPGTFAVAFCIDGRRPPTRFETPAARHFYGHGVFTADERLLIATENDFENGVGRLGIYDATNHFQRIDEIDSFGVGPHDLAWDTWGEHLIVANGGIETHPDIGRGRTKLNLATMAPNIAVVDFRQRTLAHRLALPHAIHRASLRHLAVGQQGTAIVGAQWQGDADADTPLVWRLTKADQLEPIRLPRGVLAGLRGYVSSVAIDRSGDIAALTSSRAGRIVFVDVSTGRFLGDRHRVDVSGIAAADTATRFVATTGGGTIAPVSASHDDIRDAETLWQWDNHAAAI